jgi:uncharacterized protein YyaL (SSP411 family)
LLTVRSRRPRPQLDDKVLTAWNGLMIAAFARAGRVLEGGRDYLADAQAAASFVRQHLWNAGTDTLLRRYRDGDAAVEAYAEDYAYLIFGLLELFQAGGDPSWLQWALTLQRRLDELFWDPVDGGWFSTTGKDPSVLLRLKEEYDGAEPAASSIAVLNLLTLSHLTGDANMEAHVERAFGSFGASASMRGRAVPMMLAALSTYHAGMLQIVIVGEPGAPDTERLTQVVHRRYLPSAVLVPISEARRSELARLLPWTAPLVAHRDQATAYVCRSFACQMPTSSPLELEAQLASWNSR